MPIYEYHCEADGPFEIIGSVGSAGPTAPCPRCAEESARVWSAPMLGTFAPAELVAALNHQEKTRYEPDVVTSLPRSHKPTPMAPLTPTLAKLPRP